MKINHLFIFIFCFSLNIFAEDWPQWGGDLGRNMVNNVETNIVSNWGLEKNLNIKWRQKLGTQSYTSPVITNGYVLIGTNNETPRDKSIKGDKGILMCFKESDGSFVWQMVHDKLSAGRVNDWPYQGICSTPFVEGEKVYYVNNRCELVCLDLLGFDDGKNDGVKDEIRPGKGNGDIIWRYDMIEELGVFPHNLATSSPLIIGDLVFIVTSHGVDEGHLNIPNVSAPSFLAIHKNTGELVWEHRGPGDNILHGQWSCPAYLDLEKTDHVIFPGGDGILYGLDQKTGKTLWTFDLNPKDSVWELGGYGTRNNIISTPVSDRGEVFLGVGQDPEHGEGEGQFYCLKFDESGDKIKPIVKWHIGGQDFGRTMSTPSVTSAHVYIADLGGRFFCLDRDTGKVLWSHNLNAAIWGSSMVVDGKVIIGDEDGDLTIFSDSSTKEIIGEFNFGDSIYNTPIAANGVLYIASKSELYAISKSNN